VRSDPMASKTWAIKLSRRSLSTRRRDRQRVGDLGVLNEHELQGDLAVAIGIEDLDLRARRA
jgi:hypothetical protein